jgi:hypothetical protein
MVFWIIWEGIEQELNRLLPKSGADRRLAEARLRLKRANRSLRHLERKAGARTVFGSAPRPLNGERYRAFVFGVQDVMLRKRLIAAHMELACAMDAFFDARVSKGPWSAEGRGLPALQGREPTRALFDPLEAASGEEHRVA